MPSGKKATLPDPEMIARETQALELRRAGVDYTTIAARVGYGSGTTARRAVMRALTRGQQEPSAEVRHLEADRLDRLQAAAWAKAIRGDLDAIEKVLSIMRQRANLLGLNHSHRLEERKQKIDELQAALVFRAVTAALDAAGLDEQQRFQVLGSFREQVAAIAAGGDVLAGELTDSSADLGGSDPHTNGDVNQ